MGQLVSTSMNVMGITDRGQVVGSNFAEDVDPAAGGACTQIAALIATRVHYCSSRRAGHSVSIQ
jgi:hypothetical protein